MDIIIWIGAALTVMGLCGIIYSIVIVTRAKRANLSDAALRERIAAILPWNLGALFISMVGLMAVTVGVLLG